MDVRDAIPDLLPVERETEAGPSTRRLDRPKVPLTLLTGYLGAGKSTLLQYILMADHGYRIAVCMNDFGDSTDIEQKSLTLNDPTSQTQISSFLSLPNGCLCCSVKDMGIAAIEEMVASLPGGIDRVLVELTGLADPGPIARRFWENEEMGDLILDGVVCVVDCRNVTNQLKRSSEGECQKQIACADLILLNKTDLVPSPIVENVKTTIQHLNPTLKISKTVRSEVDLEEIFNLRGYSNGIRPVLDDNYDHVCGMGLCKEEGCDHEHGHEYRKGPRGEHEYEHEHEHRKGRREEDKNGNGQENERGRKEEETTHQHDHSIHKGISTISIPIPSLSLDQMKTLNIFLEDLLWTNKLSGYDSSPEVLRTKGLVVCQEGEYVLQGVTDLFELKLITSNTLVEEDSLSLEDDGGMEDAPGDGHKQGGMDGHGQGQGDGDGDGKITGKIVFIGSNLGEVKQAFIKALGINT
ncbi:hypothetical protein TREMEDRAFT_59665 [Tremella mesenterica DSM 1558]|uniref:uncharacterized protein n=1 Tax=Tremella mesenterica (strain ATCC 24925 / CBS 8224 / DSM 1558 / NBRC 9311 / NRRL Y-6157 / RJB 2259-6 / UBC 559-6) TaxID=578456 RepID=UPI0003F4A298|nr:uncharacterized protein TREMEDRAFT_59665 [Tremella mesenterica DSM 1558]EIW73491.1 hypothetical protein TREMEDRAFT_59665 [Tremella mesenterica DSM 1558]